MKTIIKTIYDNNMKNTIVKNQQNTRLYYVTSSVSSCFPGERDSFCERQS